MSPDRNDTQSDINIAGKDRGYIVSHINYGNYDYLPNQTDSLTIKGLDFQRIEVDFETLDVYESAEGECGDYISILTLDKICGYSPFKTIVDMQSSDPSITIAFKTGDERNKKGFWMSYKGEKLLPINLSIYIYCSRPAVQAPATAPCCGGDLFIYI